ncbi:MAG: DUF4339 domain-containing protein [Planctomycetes bacterium]|nr:DUF4339 domain-containing protein [Planctomycetota bacterium]
MNENWYVLKDGVAEGPFDLAAMQARAAEGGLRAETQVCRVGAQGWSWADADEALRPLVAAQAAFARPVQSWSFARGFELLKAWRGPCWGTLVLIGLLWLVALLPHLAMSVMAVILKEETTDEAMLALQAGQGLIALASRLLVDVPLQASIAVIGASAIRGDLRVGDMLVAYRRYFGVLGASMLFGAVVALGYALVMLPIIAVPLMLFAGSSSRPGSGAFPSGVAVVLLIAGGVVLSLLLAFFAIRWIIRYAFAISIVCDPVYRSVKVFEAFRMSAAAVRGSEGSIFLFYLVTGLLASLTFLLLGVGFLLIGWPLLACAHGATYHLLIRGQPPRTDGLLARA